MLFATAKANNLKDVSALLAFEFIDWHLFPPWPAAVHAPVSFHPGFASICIHFKRFFLIY